MKPVMNEKKCSHVKGYVRSFVNLTLGGLAGILYYCAGQAHLFDQMFSPNPVEQVSKCDSGGSTR